MNTIDKTLKNVCVKHHWVDQMLVNNGIIQVCIKCGLSRRVKKDNYEKNSKNGL